MKCKVFKKKRDLFVALSSQMSFSLVGLSHANSYVLLRKPQKNDLFYKISLNLNLGKIFVRFLFMVLYWLAKCMMHNTDLGVIDHACRSKFQYLHACPHLDQMVSGECTGLGISISLSVHVHHSANFMHISWVKYLQMTSTFYHILTTDF